FAEFGGSRPVTPPPFPRIPYAEAMRRYATDKPDLRNPLEMRDVSAHFRGSGFRVFAGRLASDEAAEGWALPAPGSGDRAFCDRMNAWAQSEGQPGLAYIFFRDGEGAGPTARNLGTERTRHIRTQLGLGDGDAVFLVCGVPKDFAAFASNARLKLGRE